MALLTEIKGSNEILANLVLDFRDAFMSLPLHDQEQAFTASVVPEGLCRKRKALRPDEPNRGTVLLWRVLGFGAKPNPLVYARAASLAMRVGQALLGAPARASCSQRQLARALCQLYTDDTVCALTGAPSHVARSIDLLLVWWRTLI